jgi:hypothetical protein
MNKENDLELDVITSEPDEGEEVSQKNETDREAKDSEEPKNEGETHRSGIRTALTGMFRKRRLVISLIIIVMALGSASALLWPRISFILKGSSSATEDLVVPDGFREEKLAPFIVPLSAGGAGKLAVVNIVALWDDLTSLRFQKNEYQIRNRIYEFLVHFEERGVNLQKKVSSLQLEMSGILRESLGIEDLTIRVREIKIY